MTVDDCTWSALTNSCTSPASHVDLADIKKVKKYMYCSLPYRLISAFTQCGWKLLTFLMASFWILKWQALNFPTVFCDFMPISAISMDAPKYSGESTNILWNINIPQKSRIL